LYNQQAFSTRYATLGDKSEAVFESWATTHGLNYVRFGLDRPPFDSFQYLPEAVRFLPDFLCEDTSSVIRNNYHTKERSHFFVEVKACGKDQRIKVKLRQIEAIRRYEQFFGRTVLFFFYDSFKGRISMRHSAANIKRIADKNELPVKTFPEGTEYYAIPTTLLEWEDYANEDKTSDQ
jgi:hypothetical protein